MSKYRKEIAISDDEGDDLNFVKNSLNLKGRQDAARSVMREHRNLDLADYSKYEHHFFKLSQEMFNNKNVFHINLHEKKSILEEEV